VTKLVAHWLSTAALLVMLGKMKEKNNQIKFLFRFTCYLFMPILVANYAVLSFDKVTLQDPDLH
jgi:hypothetical protein